MSTIERIRKDYKQCAALAKDYRTKHAELTSVYFTLSKLAILHRRKTEGSGALKQLDEIIREGERNGISEKEMKTYKEIQKQIMEEVEDLNTEIDEKFFSETESGNIWSDLSQEERKKLRDPTKRLGLFRKRFGDVITTYDLPFPDDKDYMIPFFSSYYGKGIADVSDVFTSNQVVSLRLMKPAEEFLLGGEEWDDDIDLKDYYGLIDGAAAAAADDQGLEKQLLDFYKSWIAKEEEEEKELAAQKERLISLGGTVGDDSFFPDLHGEEDPFQNGDLKIRRKLLLFFVFNNLIEGDKKKEQLIPAIFTRAEDLVEQCQITLLFLKKFDLRVKKFETTPFGIFRLFKCRTMILLKQIQDILQKDGQLCWVQRSLQEIFKTNSLLMNIAEQPERLNQLPAQMQMVSGNAFPTSQIEAISSPLLTIPWYVVCFNIGKDLDQILEILNREDENDDAIKLKLKNLSESRDLNFFSRGFLLKIIGKTPLDKQEGIRKMTLAKTSLLQEVVSPATKPSTEEQSLTSEVTYEFQKKKKILNDFYDRNAITQTRTRLFFRPTPAIMNDPKKEKTAILFGKKFTDLEQEFYDFCKRNHHPFFTEYISLRDKITADLDENLFSKNQKKSFDQLLNYKISPKNDMYRKILLIFCTGGYLAYQMKIRELFIAKEDQVEDEEEDPNKDVPHA